MVSCHALSASATPSLDSWIVDSGATCHNDKGLKGSRGWKGDQVNESGCQIRGAKERLIATGSRVGSLYYLDHQTSPHQVHAVTNGSQEKKEDFFIVTFYFIYDKIYSIIHHDVSETTSAFLR